jgi:hypothetical protein
MVKLCLKLVFLRDDEWVDDAGVQEYDAATLDGLCLQIGETLLGFGWIKHIDGVKVDSCYGVATEGWYKVLSIGDIPRPQAKLRIVQDDGAAEPTGSGQKRGIDAVDDAAEETCPMPKLAKQSKCEHGRRKPECRHCGGASICVHGKRKSRCKECGGASICVHGRRKDQCKDCRGAVFCKHNRRKNECRYCGGASFCPHGRRKSRCKECGGASMCVHGREKHRCKECGGASICEHGREKHRCKECGGASVCEHGRQKHQCNECKEVLGTTRINRMNGKQNAEKGRA